MTWFVASMGWWVAVVFFVLWVVQQLRNREGENREVALHEAALIYAINEVGGGVRLRLFMEAFLTGDTDRLATSFPTWAPYRDRHLAAEGWSTE